jgi:hypothetical protein
MSRDYICIYFSKVMSSVSLCHHTSGRYHIRSFHDKGLLQLLFRRKQNSRISIGSRYRSRNAAHIVWEVMAQYEGTDGLPYVMLRNLSDGTWQKTMSQTELEHGEQYSRVTESFKSR